MQYCYEIKLDAAQAQSALCPVIDNLKQPLEVYNTFVSKGCAHSAVFKSSHLTSIVAACNKFKIDGNAVENQWFPKESFHIFLSHSHADEELAVMLATVLKEQANLDVFVDSMVWNFRDELISKLWDSSGDGLLSGDVKIQRYRNLIGHVDCMLNKSLLQMIDSCECLLFLNTPNSVTASDVSRRTYSPWIYSELEASRFVRRHQDPRRKPSTGGRAIAMDSALPIEYKLPRLQTLNMEMVKQWLVRIKTLGRQPFAALDALYKLAVADDYSKAEIAGGKI